MPFRSLQVSPSRWYWHDLIPSLLLWKLFNVLTVRYTQAAAAPASELGVKPATKRITEKGFRAESWLQKKKNQPNNKYVVVLRVEMCVNCGLAFARWCLPLFVTLLCFFRLWAVLFWTFMLQLSHTNMYTQTPPHKHSYFPYNTTTTSSSSSCRRLIVSLVLLAVAESQRAVKERWE